MTYRPRLKRGFCSALLAGPLLVVTFVAHTALAQSEQELSNARARFQRAVELEQAHNYTAALEQFRSVGQVRMTPQVRFHIASCEEHLGRLVTALGGYELALTDAERVGHDFASEAAVAVERLRASVPKLSIERGAGADTAEIALDGVTLGASSIGLPIPLDPGPHAVTAKAAGALPYSRTVMISENEQGSVVVQLWPEPGSTTTEKPASVSTSMASGARPRSVVAPYAIGGVGVLSLLGSGVFFALRQGALGDLDAKCGADHKGCPSSAHGELDHLKVYNTAAPVALGVGLLGVGAAVTLLVLGAERTAAVSGFVLRPNAPFTWAGASLERAF